MSVQNAWGAPVAAAAAPVRLHDVMDEELAAKLQREEEEQWEREIAAQFGDRENVGWCFVEVPSTDSNEFGVMSVVQQEVPREEPSGDPNDPDYAFALELQAQEAEEYDRLRRQEASSIERIQVMQQGPGQPPKDVLSSTQQRSFRPSGNSRSRRSLSRYSSMSSAGEFAVHIEEEYEYEHDADDRHQHQHHHDHRPALQQHYDDDDRDDEDLFLEDDDLLAANFNALDISLRHNDRKRRGLPTTASASSMRSTPSSRSTTSSHAHHSRS